jgi:hypothetical protein
MSDFLDFLGDLQEADPDDSLLGWDPIAGDELGDLDMVSGDDEIGWDVLGARPVHRAAARHPLHQRMNIRQVAAAKRMQRANAAVEELENHSGVQGVPSRQPVVEPLGFTVVTFTAASGTTLQATATPQKKMKGNRLVIDEVRSATAVGLVTLASLKIGTREVLVSAQPVPARMFAPGAFGVALRLVEAGPGIIITATFVISAAPAGADTVTVSAAMNALTME